MDELTERLVRVYHEIHRILREVCNAGPDEPFLKLLKQAATNSTVQAYERDLTNLNAIRVVIIDGWYDEPIATPTLALVAKMERIRDMLRRPPVIGPLFRAPVAVCAAADPIDEVAAIMRNGNFSQIPVYDASALVAILTKDTIARWFSACFSREGSVVGETQVQSVLEDAETPDNYALLAPHDTVFDALPYFHSRQKQGKRCDATLITQDGSKTTEALGIITAFDIPRLYEAIR